MADIVMITNDYYKDIVGTLGLVMQWHNINYEFIEESDIEKSDIKNCKLIIIPGIRNITIDLVGFILKAKEKEIAVLVIHGYGKKRDMDYLPEYDKMIAIEKNSGQEGVEKLVRCVREAVEG